MDQAHHWIMGAACVWDVCVDTGDHKGSNGGVTNTAARKMEWEKQVCLCAAPPHRMHTCQIKERKASINNKEIKGKIESNKAREEIDFLIVITAAVNREHSLVKRHLCFSYNLSTSCKSFPNHRIRKFEHKVMWLGIVTLDWQNSWQGSINTRENKLCS